MIYKTTHKAGKHTWTCILSKEIQQPIIIGKIASEASTDSNRWSIMISNRCCNTRHWYRGGVVQDCKWANLVLKQQSYGPWCISKMLCASFPCSNFRTFLPIFFRLCIDIGIGEEWYGIASGIISIRKTELWPLIYVQNAFLVNIVRMNRRISIKFCICIA